MSDSKMFTNNKMPEGYDEVWKRFGEKWCGNTIEHSRFTIGERPVWIGKHGKPLAPYREPSTPSNLNRNADYLRRKFRCDAFARQPFQHCTVGAHSHTDQEYCYCRFQECYLT